MDSDDGAGNRNTSVAALEECDDDAEDAIGNSNQSLSASKKAAQAQEDAVATLALSRVSITVKPGELIALVGQVGCGKSSILRALLGI